MNRRPFRSVAPLVPMLSFVLMLGVSACSSFSPRKPSIVILSPPSASQFREGEQITIQSTATDARGIMRVEFAVDDQVVRMDTPPTPMQTFTVTQTWQATAGPHMITVRAVNTSNVLSDPATIQVSVLGSSVAAAPSLTPSADLGPTTPGACMDDAEFVADVTISDGTVLAARQAFDKIWRVRNTGTCTWGPSYQFTLLSGQVMATTPIGVPVTAPGRTVDVSVPMTAPAAPGTYSSFWRMRNLDGAFFGVTLNVTIRIANGAATTCAGTPNIESITASTTTLTLGQSATLSWGMVSNAESAVIDNNIGGVATPGSIRVAPPATTTYTLTARCGSNTRTAQVTITVNPAPRASPSLTPVPPTPTATATIAPSPTVTASPSATSGVTTITRCFIIAESGEAIKSGDLRLASPLPQAGDDTANNTHRALFSFDIQDIRGKTIDSGTLNINAAATQGNPLSLGPLLAQEVTFTPPVVGTNFAMAGTTIVTINSGPVGTYDIKSPLQAAASASRTRFRIRLQLADQTNNNNIADLFTFTHADDICLNMTYH